MSQFNKPLKDVPQILSLNDDINNYSSMEIGYNVEQYIKYDDDCNNCKHLNLTEDEQRRQSNKSNHVCTKFNKQLKHHIGLRSIYAIEYSDKIKRCDECEENNCFESRQYN